MPFIDAVFNRSHDGGNDGLLKDIIDLALRIGSFSAAVRNPDGQLHNLADAQCWVGRNIGDIKMVDRPEHRVGIATYACIPQPAIRNVRIEEDLAPIDIAVRDGRKRSRPPPQPGADHQQYAAGDQCNTGAELDVKPSHQQAIACRPE